MGGYTFTSDVRSTLALACEEAIALGHAFVGTEHLLLGCLREGKSIAAQVLGQHEVTEARLLAVWPEPA